MGLAPRARVEAELIVRREEGFLERQISQA